MSNIKDMTLEELLAVPYSKTRGEIGTFKGFIIVPTGDLHDSGFGCMKFVLTLHDDIVGAVGGWCEEKAYCPHCGAKIDSDEVENG